MRAGVLHKRYDLQGIQTVYTKMDHPSREPCNPPPPPWKGGPRPRWPLQYDGMGRGLSASIVLMSVNYNPYVGEGGSITPPRQPHEGSVTTKLAGQDSGTTEKPLGLHPWKDSDIEMATSPGGLLRTSRRYFSLGPHMSCNRTQVIRELYHN
jgi:hypothetical protein